MIPYVFDEGSQLNVNLLRIEEAMQLHYCNTNYKAKDAPVPPVNHKIANLDARLLKAYSALIVPERPPASKQHVLVILGKKELNDLGNNAPEHVRFYSYIYKFI